MLSALNSSGFSILCLVAAILAGIYALISLIQSAATLAWMLPAAVCFLSLAFALNP